jgi:hypothetical protein
MSRFTASKPSFAPPSPSSMDRCIPVSVGPGQTAFTRMPDVASSSATDRVRPRTACLLAVYGARSAAPTRETAEPALMMDPPRPAASMTPAACFMFSQTPRTLTAMIRSKSSTS